MTCKYLKNLYLRGGGGGGGGLFFCFFYASNKIPHSVSDRSKMEIRNYLKFVVQASQLNYIQKDFVSF